MLNVTITPHREFLPSDTPDQRLFIMLKLLPAVEAANSRPSTTFAFLIDTSGSMYEVVAGNPQPTGNTFTQDGREYQGVKGGISKLDIAMESLRAILNSGRLTPEDRIALIQFDDQANILVGLTPGNQPHLIEDGISRLRDFSGGTCIGRGMNQALSLLANQEMTNRRALIFTDGETFDEDDCRALASQFSISGIPITALGIGEYNENLLVELGDITSGHVHHLVPGNPIGNEVGITDLPALLIKEHLTAQSEVINNIKVNLKTVQGVQLQRITRVYPDQAEIPLTNQPYPIGAASKNDETIFILEFSLDSRVSSRARIAQLGLTYDVPGLNRRGELPPQNIIVQFVAGQGGGSQVDQEVMGYVQQRNIAQLVGDATRVADSNPQQAEKLLETARRMTVKIGNDAMLASLNQASDELRKTQKISPGTRKTVKMGSRGKTVKMSGGDINDQLSDENIRKLTGT